MTKEFLDRNLALEAVRVTEAAALSSSLYMGRGDEKAADQAAVNAMRDFLNHLAIDGKVVIGEGERDKAPMLYIGEEMGMGVHDLSMPKVDIAVDPLECTAHCAENLPNSICVLSIAPRGNLLHAPECYMDKIAGSAELKGHVSLDKTIEDNIKSISSVTGKDLKDIKVIVLNRPRNKNTINTLIDLGLQLDLIQNGCFIGTETATSSGNTFMNIFGLDKMDVNGNIIGDGTEGDGIWQPGDGWVDLNNNGQIDKPINNNGEEGKPSNFFSFSKLILSSFKSSNSISSVTSEMSSIDSLMFDSPLGFSVTNPNNPSLLPSLRISPITVCFPDKSITLTP